MTKGNKRTYSQKEKDETKGDETKSNQDNRSESDDLWNSAVLVGAPASEKSQLGSNVAKRNRVTGPNCIDIVPPSDNMFHIVVPKLVPGSKTCHQCDWIKPGSACVTDGTFLYYSPNFGNDWNARVRQAARRLVNERLGSGDGDGSDGWSSYSCKYNANEMDFVGYFILHGEIECIMDRAALKEWMRWDFDASKPRGICNQPVLAESIHMFRKMESDDSHSYFEVPKMTSCANDECDSCDVCDKYYRERLYKIVSRDNPEYQKLKNSHKNYVQHEGHFWLEVRLRSGYMWSTSLFKEYCDINSQFYSDFINSNKEPLMMDAENANYFEDLLSDYAKEEHSHLYDEEFSRRAIQKHLQDFYV